MNLGIILSIITVICVLAYFQKPYTPPPIIIELKKRVSLVHPMLGKFDIRESFSSSYTQNKTTIYICTRDPSTKKYYNYNTLVYVCLHECAHMLSGVYDHEHTTKEFRTVFDGLLKRATMIGLYDPNIPIPPTYCGLN